MAVAAGACAGDTAGKHQAMTPTGRAAVGTAGTSPSAPGTDARIQQWFLGNEKVRVAFNNVLFKAEKDIASGNTQTNCSALVTATAKVSSALANLSAISPAGASIAAAYGPPIDEFSRSGKACAAGDFNTARSLLGSNTTGAIAAYGNAQETVDEILDGGQ